MPNWLNVTSPQTALILLSARSGSIVSDSDERSFSKQFATWLSEFPRISKTREVSLSACMIFETRFCPTIPVAPIKNTVFFMLLPYSFESSSLPSLII